MNNLLEKHNFQSWEEARDFCKTFWSSSLVANPPSPKPRTLVEEVSTEEVVSTIRGFLAPIAPIAVAIDTVGVVVKEKKQKDKKKRGVTEVKNYCIIDTSRYTEVKLQNGEFLNRNGSYFKILLGKTSTPPGKYFFFKIIKETKTSLTVEELRQDENNPERFYFTGVKNQYHGWVKYDGALSKASRRIQLFE